MFNAPIGKLIVRVSFLENEPFEVFVTISKSGSAYYSLVEAIGRLCSLALRSKVPLSEIIDQLRGISEGNRFYSEGEELRSLPDAVGFVLQEIKKKGELS